MPTLNYDGSIKDIIYDDTNWISEIYGLIDTEDEESEIYGLIDTEEDGEEQNNGIIRRVHYKKCHTRN